MLTFPHYHFLCSHKTGNRNIEIIMTYINEEEEKLIDDLKDKVLKLDRGKRTFSINTNQVFCYGEVDFNDVETLNIIDKFNFLNYLEGTGISICSNYDYKTHSCTSPKRTPLYTETWSPALLAQFAHASINKPQRIILFSQSVK